MSDKDLREELVLIQRALARDSRAWAEFTRRYENLIVACVIKTLRRYNASFSSDELADIVAEVWVRLLNDDMRKLRMYDPSRGYRLASWLGLITTNCTIDHLRLRPAEHVYVDDLSSFDWIPESTDQPDRKIQVEEEASLARRALRQLSSADRQFVISCFHEERPPEILAQELGVTVNTVYSRKVKVRQKLERLVASLEDLLPALAA